jgi:hypothetical protein
MLPRQMWLIWMSAASRLTRAIRHLESVYRGNVVILRGLATERVSSISWWQSVPIVTTTWNGTSHGRKRRAGQTYSGCIHSLRESLISLRLIGRAAHSALQWIISTSITTLSFCRWLPVGDTGTFSEHHTGPWTDHGPVEYVFNMIHTLLLQYFCTIDDLPVLGNRIDTVIAQMTNFKNYFLHVRLSDNW